MKEIKAASGFKRLTKKKKYPRRRSQRKRDRRRVVGGLLLSPRVPNQGPGQERHTHK